MTLDPHTWASADVAHLRTGHEYLLDHPHEGKMFEGYDPHRPLVDPARFRMGLGQRNVTGYVQRAWIIWHALKELWLSGEIGLELGSGGVKTPWCLSTDYHTGQPSDYPKEKPPEQREIVGGHLRVDGTDLSRFRCGSFRAVFAAHVMEHFPGDPVEHFLGVMRVLQPGGLFVGIMPDNDFLDVMKADYTHQQAFGSKGYLENVILRSQQEIKSSVEEFTTFGTEFAYFWAVRRS